MKSWYKNWDVISPIFKFSADVRKVIYTTNSIESLKRLSSSEQTEKRVFQRYGTFKGFVSGNPRDYKEVDDAAKNWGRVLGELEIMYPDRLS